jgi:competence protein ComGC
MLKMKMIAMVILLLSSSVVQAKDVSIQQTGYNSALKKMESAEAEYNVDAQAVADTEKLIEKKNRQLAEERKKADISKAKFLDAKEKLEQAQAILDKAWKD